METIFEPHLLKVKQEQEQLFVWDIIRKKWIQLNAEEEVRQLLLHFLLQHCAIPKGLVAIEKQIKVGSLNKRFDIIIYDSSQQPWMLIECKAPHVELNSQTWYQLLDYNQTIQAKYGLISNGLETQLASFDSKIGSFTLLNTFPKWDNA